MDFLERRKGDIDTIVSINIINIVSIEKRTGCYKKGMLKDQELLRSKKYDSRN